MSVSDPILEMVDKPTRQAFRESSKVLIDQEWYDKHRKDITQEVIDAQGIEISVDGRKLPDIHEGEKKGLVKNLVALQTA